MNAFKHGLAAIQKRREERITTEQEESVRQQIICGSDLSAAIHFAGRVKGGTSLP
jgi:predicted RNase H-like nuclease (RuvC/YqgF family)